MRVALVSALAALGTDEDERLLIDALNTLGVDASTVSWDDPEVPWSGFDLAVVRSAWDYHLRHAEFLDWAGVTAAQVRLRNGPAVLRWNTDKAYLLHFASAGVPIVPTTVIRPGDPIQMPTGEIVVKPTVSAGSLDTARYPDALRDAALDHIRRITDDGRDALVQPYQASVDSRGETALLFIGGEYSHAANKGALLPPDGVSGVADGGLYAREVITPVQPSAGEREVAEQVMDAAPFDRDELLYARVDILHSESDGPLLLEFELAEPSLFLSHAPASATERFARAILATARR